MGGTFDPIHNGHLILAECARVAFDLEKIIFMPTGRPPHKEEENISSMDYRYDMTLLAINENPYFNLSSMEIQREGTTYTIDTVKSLQAKYKNTEFYFIIGSDSFYNIHKWKDYEELLSLCKFIIAKRPDIDNLKLEDRAKKFNQSYNNPIHILDAPPLIDISSTRTRDRIKNGLSIRYLVPDAVEIYIKKNKLYS